MKPDKNVMGWFEIAVSELDRAIKFYETVFGYELEIHDFGKMTMAWFPQIENAIGSMGSLVYYPEYYQPSAQGPIMYFTCFSGDVANELSRVEQAGGKILMDKTKISDEYGYMALIMDTEGNKIGLHAKN